MTSQTLQARVDGRVILFAFTHIKRTRVGVALDFGKKLLKLCVRVTRLVIPEHKFILRLLLIRGVNFSSELDCIGRF